MLEIEQLRVEFGDEAAPLIAVDGVDMSLEAGDIVGCVGESGSGKSVTALAIMGLVDFPGRVRAKRLSFAGHDLLHMSAAQRRAVIGKDIAMIFQDPLASLNPCYTVAFQLNEALRVHGTQAQRHSGKVRRAKSLELLEQVEIPDAQTRLDAFPHQLSGGMAQRVMIAMAIACQPRLLIADEPTTALDVTVQAQVLDLLCRLQRERGMALLLITHDLAVVAETAQRVVVMYAGQQVETGPLPAVFDAATASLYSGTARGVARAQRTACAIERDPGHRSGSARPARRLSALIHVANTPSRDVGASNRRLPAPLADRFAAISRSMRGADPPAVGPGNRPLRSRTPACVDRFVAFAGGPCAESPLRGVTRVPASQGIGARLGRRQLLAAGG